MFLWLDILAFIHSFGGRIIPSHQVHPHADTEAFLQSTLWTLASHEQVNLALSAILTAWYRLFLDTPSEEGLAACARPSAVILAQRLGVSTHQALTGSIHGELRNVAYWV